MKDKSMFRSFVVLFLFFISKTVFAGAPDGRWVFDKMIDSAIYKINKKSPDFLSFTILNNKISLSPRCVVDIRNSAYYPDGIFQDLLKSGSDEHKIEMFLSKNFSFKLSQVKEYYSLDDSRDCTDKFGYDFLVDDKQLIVVYSGSVFVRYLKYVPSAVMNVESSKKVPDYKISSLPFNFNDYYGVCVGKIPLKKGVPQSTDKCGPIFYPYAASSKSKNELEKTIGTHNYIAHGSVSTGDDYKNPLSNNLHPVFLVFPSLKEIGLVRVDDLEQGDRYNRDGISGVYLSIKDGRVIDQIDGGCNMNDLYVCINDQGVKEYQLLESGKFKKF